MGPDAGLPGHRDPKNGLRARNHRASRHHAFSISTNYIIQIFTINHNLDLYAKHSNPYNLGSTMKKINLICATPPSINLGMYSVDIAFEPMLSRNDIEASVEYYMLDNVPQFMLQDNDLPHQYRCFRNRLDEVFDCDAIIFWGDFHQGLKYQQSSVLERMLYNKIAKDASEAFEIIQSHYMFENAPEHALAKTILFGTTLILNDARDYNNIRYYKNLKRILGSCKEIMTRDAYSAIKISHIVQRYDRSYLGVDCSLLLKDEDLEFLPKSGMADENQINQKVGVFFGRSMDCRLHVQFALELCHIVDAKPSWIPWLRANSSELPSLLGNESSANICNNELFEKLDPDLDKKSYSWQSGDVFAALKEYRFIITDTYHLCLNSWRVGTPAICIGSGSSPNQRAAHDKKKECFFNMYDANSFYVYYEDLGDAEVISQIARRIAETVLSQETSERVYQNILSHSLDAEQRLVCSLRELTV